MSNIGECFIFYLSKNLPEINLPPVNSDIASTIQQEEPAEVQPVEDAAAEPETNGDDFGYYISTYPYASNEPGDLSFQAGELVIVTKKEGDWWTGNIGDRIGMFPCNYVTKTEFGQMTPASATTTVSAADEQSMDYSFQKVSNHSLLPHTLFHVNCFVSNQTNLCFFHIEQFCGVFLF